MSLLFSLVSGIAGGIFRAAKAASAEAEEARQKATLIADAQARGSLAQARGSIPKSPFAQQFQSQIARLTDANGDGLISKDELEKQVTAGGGDSAQAGTLFKAMDKNGDGKLTLDEFKENVPVPQAALAQQLVALIQAHREANAGNANGTGAKANGAAAIAAIGSTANNAVNAASGAAKDVASRFASLPPVEPSAILAKLAAQTSAAVTVKVS